MATPVRIKGTFYEEAYLIKEYKLIDDFELKERIRMDVAFAKAVKTNKKIRNPFVVHQNHYFHDIKPPEKWKWSNTPEWIQNYILGGLVNKGRLAIIQKRLLHENIESIMSIDERKRVLIECDVELVRIGFLLDAFKCFDRKVLSMRNDVNTEWKLDPDPKLITTISPTV
jgi:hypothetical protein